jgi:hypothetical protein
LKSLAELGEILYGGDDEVDLDCMLCSPLASTTSKWRIFKLLRWAEILKRLVDLDEVLYGGDDVEDDLDSVLLNSVASTIPKWLTLKLLR